MFKHIYVYRLKVLLKNKEMLFWTLIFPIALSIFFKVAFGGLVEQGTFRAINIAVVENQNNPSFIQTIETLSTGDKRLFNTFRVDELEALRMLELRSVQAILTVDDEISMTVAQVGVAQSIVQSFLDQYNSTAHAVNRILTTNPAALEQVIKDVQTRVVFTIEQPITQAKMNITLNYFYALIAMTCLYGGFFGVEEVNSIQANLSVYAARVNVAPVHKLKIFLFSSAASFTIQFSQIVLFLLFLQYVLQVDFSNKTGWVLLTSFVGSLVGLSMGAFISSLFKCSESLKTGILIGTTMLGSFLAGMMFVDVKYLVQTHVPLLAILNPVNLVSDSFYALYFFDDLTRYFQNMGLLMIFITVFTTITYLNIRRRTYASL
jgi:ABC-2 type transport system permease protein